MFSGIIAALGVVKNITYDDIYSFDIEIKKINLEGFEESNNLIKIGCSISCSGVCLTIVEIFKSFKAFNSFTNGFSFKFLAPLNFQSPVCKIIFVFVFINKLTD